MNTQNISSVSINSFANNVAVSTYSNPVAITLQTGADAAESFQYFAIITMSAPTLTTYLDFNITFPIQYHIRYYAKSPIDAESFYTSAENPTVSLNLDRIAQILRNNPTLSNMYSIEKISNTEVKVTSKLPGSQYNLQNVLTVSTGLNVSFGSFVADVAAGQGQKISDLYMFVQLLAAENNANDIITVPNTSKFLEVQTLLKPYNQTNRVQFDIAPAINSVLSKNAQTNRPQAVLKNDIVLLDSTSNDSIHFRLQYGVQYSRGTSNIPVQQVYGTVSGKKAYNMALPIDEYNDAVAYLTYPVKFRTNKTSPKLKRKEYHALHFHIVSTLASIQCRYYVTFSDSTSSASPGSISTWHVGATVQSPQKNLYTLMFQVEEFVRRQEEFFNKTAIAFGLAICSNGNNTPITEIKRFQIDNKFYEYPTYLFYQNSLGGYDSFTMTGRSENRSDIDRLYYVDTNTIDYKNGEKIGATRTVGYMPTYTLSSGPIDERQYRDLKELVKSKNVYALVPYSNQSTHVYEYSSCDLLPEASGATATWTNTTAITQYTNEHIANGNNSTVTEYSAQLQHSPVYDVDIHATGLSLEDNGFTELYGAGPTGGYGFIDYNTGEMTFTTNTAVSSSTQIFADYKVPAINSCYRSVVLTASLTQARGLYVYSGYFPSGTQAFAPMNNFKLRVGRVKSTPANGATDLGNVRALFYNGVTVTKISNAQNLTTTAAYYDFDYNERLPADKIMLIFGAINYGDDQVTIEFSPGEGFIAQPIEVKYKYLKITGQDYKDTDGDDIKEVNFTCEDTIQETNL